MDIWQQIDKQIVTLKTEYDKYIADNPKLIKENNDLKDKLLELNKSIVDAQEKLEGIRTEGDKITVELERKKTDTMNYVDSEMNAFNLELEKRTTELDDRENFMNSREESWSEREMELSKRHQSNSTQSVALDELAKQLQLQADEIKDATKVLNTKSIDNQHELNMIRQRGAELDAQEARNSKDDQDIDERTKVIQANEKRSRANLAQSEQLLSTNQLRGIELDKREQFQKNTDKELKDREIKLKQRTDSFVGSLRAGKML